MRMKMIKRKSCRMSAVTSGTKMRRRTGRKRRRELWEESCICRKASHHRWICWMDSLTVSEVCGEVGTGAPSPRTRISTREQSGAIGARGRPGLGWTPWREEGTSRDPRTPRPLPSKPQSTITKTAAPPVPHHQTLRKKAISWDNPYLCPRSSGNIRLRRAQAERRSKGGRCSETGA